MRVAHLLVAATAFVSAAGLVGAEQPKAQMTTQQGAETIVEQAQKKLAALDLKPGPVNGIEHKQTQEAVKRFQKSQKLDVSGRLDAKTLTALGVRPATTVARSAPPSSEQLSMIASVGMLPSESSSASPSESSSASPSQSSSAPSSESSSAAQSESISPPSPSNRESSSERTAEPSMESAKS